MQRKVLIVLSLGVVLCTTPSDAQVFTGFPPAVPPLSGAELLPADTGASPPNVVISTGQLAQFVMSFDPGQNWVIAGDAGQNLFQRGVVGPISAGAVVFGPDRWAYWSGASTQMSVNEDSTPGSTPPGFSAAYQMQRHVGVSGVAPMCMAQELSSVNSVSLQGRFVELDFNVFGGPNLSSSLMRIYIVMGTGVNEGVGKLAFGLNGGGGGSVGWTGQTNVVSANFSPLTPGTLVHPAVVGRVPTTAGEVAVAFCVFPSGTAGGGDYVDFSGIQMRLAPALAPFASPVRAYIASALQVPPFVWRMGNQEAFLQYSYYLQFTESAGLTVVGGNCRVGPANNQADCFMQFPVPMGQTPTMSYVTGFAVDTSASSTQPCTGLGTTPGVSASVGGVTVRCTAGSNVKAASFLYNEAGSGIIAADAEWH